MQTNQNLILSTTTQVKIVIFFSLPDPQPNRCFNLLLNIQLKIFEPQINLFHKKHLTSEIGDMFVAMEI